MANPVKADKRGQFEKFVNEVFWPEAERLREAERHVFRHTRVPYPTEPEPDGTYIYFFLRTQ